MIKEKNYSVDAGANLDTKPTFTLGPKEVGTHVRKQFYAKCIVVVRKPRSVLCLSETQIADGLTISEGAEGVLRDDLGLMVASGKLQLHGRFIPDFRKPPVYLLIYIPTKSELEQLENSDLHRKVVADSTRQAPVPVGLCGLLLAMGPKGELGHNEDGQLCVWSKAVEDRVFARIEEDKAEAARRLKRHDEQRFEERLAA